MNWNPWGMPQDAAGWVVRLANGPVDRRAWMAFGRWLQRDPKRAEAFLRHTEIWKLAADLPTEPSIARAIALARRPVPRSAGRRWMLVGAGAAMVAMTGLIVYRTRSDFETGFGETRRIPLADGSIIYLNTSSRVVVAFSAERRQVTLERGEAFFEVAHDTARPFEVVAADRRVTAVGTKFSVIRAVDGIKVAVAQGAVEVGSVSPAAPITEPMTRLDAGAQLVQLAASGAPTITRVDVNRVASWRLGLLIFDESLVGHVAEEMNRYSSRKLIVDDPEIRALHLGGTFAMDDTESVATALKEIYGLRILREGKNLRIAR